MNPSTDSTVEAVVEQAAQINPWALTPPTDASTAWLDAAGSAVQPEQASGFHLTQIFDGSLPLESWINQGLGWVVAHFRPFFQAVRAPIDSVLSGMEGALLAVPSLTLIAIIGLLAWQFTSRTLALGSVLALLLVSMLGIWPEAMTTLSLVLTSLAF
jgi:glycine betaine/proline transport system permease protein